jgi:serine/threonine protein kinase
MSMVGTPLYMAPEVHAHAGHGPAADIFSLGVMLVAMLQGRYLALDRSDLQKLLHAYFHDGQWPSTWEGIEHTSQCCV